MNSIFNFAQHAFNCLAAWRSKFFMASIVLFSLGSPSLHAECVGKIDVGPAYIRIDILESGKTVKTMNQGGIRLDGAYNLYRGFCIKPAFMYGSGEGSLFSAGCSFGPCIPVSEGLYLTPGIGYSFSQVRTTINLPHFFLRNLKEQFRSYSPYIALDASYNFAKSWRVNALVQYAWSRTHTRIQHLLKAKGHSKGPSYALSLEKDLTEIWSVNLGIAYNVSLSHEKHGIRGAGAKIGLARWF